MNKFRKIAIVVIAIEIVMIVLSNIIFTVKLENHAGRFYRVEAQRLVKELENTSLQELDLSKYESIVSVKEFRTEEPCNHDYIVEEIDGKWYRIEYLNNRQYPQIWIFNLSLFLMLFFTIIMLVYISKKVLTPFDKMSNLTYELAKGNLSMPIKAEKSKLFGRFLWGMDMLRETLEENKVKELELQKEKKTLILSLSHDIKTPLSAIDLYTRALSENLYDTQEKRKEALEGIARNVQEIKAYVNEIVSASREDFLNLKVQKKEFYLQDFMTVIELYYKDKLSVLHTEFEIEKVENCLIVGDMDRLIEVVQNAMENAIKYGNGRKISIAVSEEEECKILQIVNTGCELKLEELPNIFDSFYRGSNCKNEKGSGLGLYIAKKLMCNMGGDVYAKVKEDNFILFVVIPKA